MCKWLISDLYMTLKIRHVRDFIKKLCNQEEDVQNQENKHIFNCAQGDTERTGIRALNSAFK